MIHTPRRNIDSLSLSAALLLATLAPWAGAEQAAAVPDFTFIQASDVHAPRQDSKATISKILGLEEIDLAPFGIKVPKPGFVIVTGDMNEFGGGSGWWAEYLSYWKGCAVPVSRGLGNHGQYVACQPEVPARPGPGALLLVRQIRLPLRQPDDGHPPGPATVIRGGSDPVAGEGPRHGRTPDTGVRLLPPSPARERVREPLRLRPVAGRAAPLQHGAIAGWTFTWTRA